MNEPKSPEMLEALKILDELDIRSGTAQEKLAVLAAARKRIWAIADRAGADSESIRRLVRGLESHERVLEEWPEFDVQPGDRG